MTLLVPLSRGMTALVDDADADVLSWKWMAMPSRESFYAGRQIRRGGKRLTVWLHKVIGGGGNGREIDHISGDTLDDCRGNLRVVTHAQNMQNRPVSKNSSTGIRGVYFNQRRSRYVARVKLGGRYVYSKRFPTLEEAAEAVVQARLRFMSHTNEQRTARVSGN